VIGRREMWYHPAAGTYMERSDYLALLRRRRRERLSTARFLKYRMKALDRLMVASKTVMSFVDITAFLNDHAEDISRACQQKHQLIRLVKPFDVITSGNRHNDKHWECRVRYGIAYDNTGSNPSTFHGDMYPRCINDVLDLIGFDMGSGGGSYTSLDYGARISKEWYNTAAVMDIVTS
jgi:hypothetical protein